jgi:hypothetical protein
MERKIRMMTRAKRSLRSVFGFLGGVVITFIHYKKFRISGDGREVDSPIGKRENISTQR